MNDIRSGCAATRRFIFPGQVGVKNEAAKPIRVLLSSLLGSRFLRGPLVRDNTQTGDEPSLLN